MTHDELIEVIAAHRDGKTLQVKGSIHGRWEECPPRKLTLLEVLADIAGGDTFRAKPEPRRLYVPIDATGRLWVNCYHCLKDAETASDGCEVIEFMEVLK